MVGLYTGGLIFGGAYSRRFTVSKHEKTMYGYPGETRARVVYMASQMNRDVTQCFRLLI